MAHEIDTTAGRAAIAFVGQTPWHGLGQQLSPNQGIEIWRRESGLDYQVLRSPVRFDNAITATTNTMPDRDVLYRSDTGAALSVVGKNYNVVQPDAILDFFHRLSDIGGFELEVAGALSGGRRVWGLAKVNDGAPIIGHDVVRPYVLFATSYDGTMATVAKMTAIRVVCNNTITMAVGRGSESNGKTESDTQNRAVSSLVRIPHSTKVDINDVRKRLGIVADVYERWLVETRLLAERAMDNNSAEAFVQRLIGSVTPSSSIRATPPVTTMKSYQRIMQLFDGGLIGGDLTGGNNCWKMLNAVTEYVDYERGKSPDSRLDGAWFGAGDALKTKAYSMLAEA
jgi:phage/plasmid-like protein (TIGR03299 family)